MKNQNPILSHLYFWLHVYSGLTPLRQSELLEKISLTELYSAVTGNCPKTRGFLGDVTFNRLRVASDANFLSREIQALTAREIQILTPDNNFYPDGLKDSRVAASNVFYCSGNIALLKTHAIGVVGTRRSSPYGEKHTRAFTQAMCAAGITIVSGLADGIDTVAHETALASGGKTIAVLAGGINHIYPKSNLSLARRIAREGLLIFEHPPATAPSRYMFLERNRIIAALSRGILISEAGEKSGALVTADYAITYGKDVFCIPGSIDSPNSVGVHGLIKAGACLVSNAAEVLSVLKIEISEKSPKNTLIQLDIFEEMVYKLLLDGEMSFNALLASAGMPVPSLNAALVGLEVKGIVRKHSGNIYGLQ